jgi:tetratricopeptide (TPR) repeat protein
LTDAVHVFRALGHRRSEINALATLSAVHRVHGRVNDALVIGQAGLELSISLGASGEHHRAVALHNLGVLALERGELEQARERLVAAVDAFISCSDIRGESLVLLRLGTLYGLLGRDADAVVALRRCLHLTESVDDAVGRAHALLALHEAFVHQRRHAEAAQALASSVRLFQNSGQLLGAARALLRLGEQARANGDVAAAEAALREALATVAMTGARRRQADVHGVLADLLADAGRSADAAAERAKAVAIYEQLTGVGGASQHA